jgi:hypothetical protein
MLNRAFSTLNRNLGLILIPIFMDLASFLLGLMTIGFWGESKVHLKLALDVGLPSIATVLEQNVLASGFSFNFGDGVGAWGFAFLLFLLFFVLGAYCEAGFIGLLYQAVAKDAPSTLDTFLYYGNRFWLRFLGLNLLVFLVTIVGGLMAMLLFVFGVIAFLVIFLILRIKYIYWEFTIVSEDMGVLEAFNRSKMHYNNRSPEMAIIIIKILVANFIAALIVNFLWSPVMIFIAIPIYSYVATGLQLALMCNKLELSDAPPYFPTE